jgi:ABC-type glycerol-3-phosphate transport system substrate-binding protein
MFFFGIGAVVLVIFIFFVIGKGTPPSPPGVSQDETELVMWGTFDDIANFEPSFSAFAAGEGAGVKITYVKKDAATYERDLINALAEGAGPDIFTIQNTWVLKYQKKVSPAPAAIVSFKEMETAFPTAVIQDLTVVSSTFAIPLYLDTLALYYNKDLFDQAAIAYPPKTWAEFVTDTAKLKRVDIQTGTVTRAGAAFGGSTKSVNRATDIVTMLMMQYGTAMTNPGRDSVSLSGGIGATGKPTAEAALDFYTRFANPATPFYTWNDAFANSIDAFADGRAAMMLGYSYHDAIIKAKNPFLNFAVARVPQQDPEQSFTFPNYWAYTVSRTSKHPDIAWRFLKFMGLQRSEAEKYTTTAQKPPALRSLVEAYTNDPRLGVFAQQAFVARSWQVPDGPEVEIIFSDMLESVLNGRLSTREAVSQAEQKINALFNR